MSEWITVTVKEIHCIKRSEFKGRADEIYLKQRGSHEWLWPTHQRAERIKKGHSVYPAFHYYYKPNEKDATLELWEHDKASKDDFLGSITFNSDSQGEHTQFMDGDGGSYRVLYSVNNPYKKQQAPAAQATKPEKAEASGVSGQPTAPSAKTATMKRLVVCCDGTWQDLEQGYPTNVVKTVQIVKPVDSEGINQVVYYHEGVGAEGNISKHESFISGTADSQMTSIAGGMLGRGIDRNIQDAYRFLCINYSPGDEIYLFGFSRGSYTVRSLAGLLSHCGLLKREFLRDIPKAYKNYRKRADRDSREMIELIPHCHPNAELDNRVPITLLACYDTVGSLGVPDHFHHIPIGKLIKREHYAFHDTVLSDIIQHALHAVSVDENRETFSLTPMQKHPEFKEQTLHQVWFPGGHGCVGGGTENESKLANNALLWMIASIKELGLKLELDNHLLTDKEQLFGKDESNQAYTDATFNYEKHPEKSRLEKIVSGGRGALTKIAGKHVRKILDDDDLHRSVSERWHKVSDYKPKNVPSHKIIAEAILESNDSILLTS